MRASQQLITIKIKLRYNIIQNNIQECICQLLSDNYFILKIVHHTYTIQFKSDTTTLLL